MFHYPVIQTVRLDSPQLQEAIALWDQFTHVIFTSKNGVRHWAEVGPLQGKIAIAIGEATGGLLHEPLIAPLATQEGVIALLETIKDGFFFYPRSKRARPHLANYLQQRPHFLLDLYDTVSVKREPVPNLEEFDEIVFTSPSTVEAFCQIYGKLPKDKKLTPIGPVTERALLRQSAHSILR